MRAAKWALLRSDGSVAAQVIVEAGKRPSDAGDNPDGLSEVRISRFGDLQHETLNPETGRWKSDPDKRRRAERRNRMREMHRDELADAIRDEVTAEVRAEIDALAARVAALEGK